MSVSPPSLIEALQTRPATVQTLNARNEVVNTETVENRAVAEAMIPPEGHTLVISVNIMDLL